MTFSRRFAAARQAESLEGTSMSQPPASPMTQPALSAAIELQEHGVPMILDRRRRVRAPAAEAVVVVPLLETRLL
jgi:hypothetical protein